MRLGLEGTYGSIANSVPFLDDWTWKLNYVWGQTQESQTNGGYYDKIKMQNALDTKVRELGRNRWRAPNMSRSAARDMSAADAIAQAAGCVPIDLFGAGSISTAAANYVKARW